MKVVCMSKEGIDDKMSYNTSNCTVTEVFGNKGRRVTSTIGKKYVDITTRYSDDVTLQDVTL